MRVEIGRVCDVEARSFCPSNEVDLAVKELACTASAVWAIERDLRSVLAARDRDTTVTVEVIETLAGLPIVGKVVVRLVGIDGLLLDEPCVASIVSDNEDDVTLEASIVRQLRKIDPARPRLPRRECERGTPVALDQARTRISRACRLREALSWTDATHHSAARSPVPTHPEHVDGVALSRSDTHVERDPPALVHADSRGVASNLTPRVGSRPCQLPASRPAATVFRLNRISRRGDGR